MGSSLNEIICAELEQKGSNDVKHVGGQRNETVKEKSYL
jgi:hypothetical protein